MLSIRDALAKYKNIEEAEADGELKLAAIGDEQIAKVLHKSRKSVSTTDTEEVYEEWRCKLKEEK